jgi:dTDP-4-amino-4,6-dideoxygalactose transaminase
MDPASLAAAVDSCSLNPVGVVAVDLYGHPADYRALAAAGPGLWLVADAAQSFGASRSGRPVGSLADVTVTSFFPSKPLGCYGDGGAVLTDDGQVAARVRSLRAHGRGEDKYDHARVGLNARLDTVQAAVLLAKLEVFDEELAARNRIAEQYGAALAGDVTVPVVEGGVASAWACYTVRTPARDAVAGALRGARVASAVYYPRPLHRTVAFEGFPRVPGGLAVSEQLAREVLSLPIHPYLSGAEVARVIAAVARSKENEAEGGVEHPKIVGV